MIIKVCFWLLLLQGVFLQSVFLTLLPKEPEQTPAPAPNPTPTLVPAPVPTPTPVPNPTPTPTPTITFSVFTTPTFKPVLVEDIPEGSLTSISPPPPMIPLLSPSPPVPVTLPSPPPQQLAPSTPKPAPPITPINPSPELLPKEVASPPKAKAKSSCQGGKPNFIVIMTDDQGHDDISFYNFNNILQTPNMDKFASESVQFEDFYTDSLCAPTRGSLFTGRHHLKTGVWGVHATMDYINLDETLISEAMKFNGYKTSFFGKWHNGITPGYNPWDRGYDEATIVKLYVFYNNLAKKNGQDIQTEGWVEDWLADRIIEYLEARNKDGEPFFLTWTPMSVHRGRKFDSDNYEDFLAPEEYYSLYEGKVSADLVKVFAALTYFDDVFGRVIQKLDDLGMGDNTVVMLFGDNGPHVYQTDHAFGPNRQIRIPSNMKNEKGFVEENGIRSFLFVRGTNRFPAGQKVFENVGVIDIYPTLLELAGGSAPPQSKSLDGLSFAPLLCESDTWSHSKRYLYFYESLKTGLVANTLINLGKDRKVDVSQKLISFYEGGDSGNGFVAHTALRWQQWKYIKGELFDLDATDHQEGRNQRAYDPALEGQLSERLENWWQSILKSPGAFEKPEFLIGLYTVSPVLAIGAVEKSGDHITIGNFNVQGLKFAGDYIICRVKVVQSGTYSVAAKFGWTGYSGVSMSVRVGQYSDIWDGTASTVARVINDYGPLKFGEMYLDRTSGNDFEEMIIQLDNTDQDGTDIFDYFDSVEFTLTSQ